MPSYSACQRQIYFLYGRQRTLDLNPDMHLSIIIVNYNAKRLLEQCLQSVFRAAKELTHEIIVVDNHSTDGSPEELPLKYTGVKFILNRENRGFATACNQGIEICSGRYVLFLNPDTLVPEDCFRRCISFFELHPDAGAVGVRMTDARGRFLKESKRGFPSPAAAFFKFIGLAALFPRSKTLAKYYAGHLPEKENQTVDILSGAFLMTRREALQQTAGFDESFFMYGEDIDLSYRLQATGYKNYYLGTISITHLKGGSTVPGREQIRNFYEAMYRFIKKYYVGKKSPVYVNLLYAGVWLRKQLSIAALIIRRIPGS